MIHREPYFSDLVISLDTPVIKVITGMRRSGKSVLLRQLLAHIQKMHQTSDDTLVIYVDKESLDRDHIQTYTDLHEYIWSQVADHHARIYLCVDEVQIITDRQKAILHRYKDTRLDIYLTWSNAQLLSSELATLLTWRYIEHKVYPLMFSEYVQFREQVSWRDGGAETRQAVFLEYLEQGWLPAIHDFFEKKEVVHQYREAVFTAIVYKDIIARYHVRKSETLLKVVTFLSDNIGKIFSNKKVVNTLIEEKLSMSVDTLQVFIWYLRNTYLIYKVPRYDIQGKQLLAIYEKYYLGDIWFRTLLVWFDAWDQAWLLENVVYLELRKRWYEVYIWKVWSLEVDFVAVKDGIPEYYQVTYLLSSEKTIEREFRSLQAIKDNHLKVVLSLDTVWWSHLDGIKRWNLVDRLGGDVG